MSSEIDIKLELLKLEKLKNEGYKQKTYGKGYTVLSKVEKPSQSVSSLNKQIDLFVYGQAQTVNTNFAIDRNIKMKVPPDPLVFIKIPRSKIVYGKVDLKIKSEKRVGWVNSFEIQPCAAFMRYIKSYPIVGTFEQTLEKKKGFTSRFNTSVELKASVSVGFKGCEASLEVKTGFEYEETVTSETTQTWKQTLTEEVILFIKIKKLWCYFCTNRDDPFTLRYQDATWDPVEYDSLIDYLAANPNKWGFDAYINNLKSFATSAG
ncbi:hypothetical protein ACTFIY_008068 [Dictyostelium cf. discoideum]